MGGLFSAPKPPAPPPPLPLLPDPGEEDRKRRLEAIPRPLRPLLAGAFRMIPVPAWNAFFAVLPSKFVPGQKGETMHWLAGNLASGGFEAIYQRLVSTWNDPEMLVPGTTEAASPFWAGDGTKDDTLERMMYLDSVTYLPDDIMAHGLEAREPLLDHRIFEFAWRLPENLKFRDGRGKWLLRKVLARYVPPALTERPKQGFSIPIGDWLRSPLRDWAEDLLSEQRLTEAGILARGVVGAAWKRLLGGDARADARMWTVLMFQAWRARWGD